MKKEVNIYLDKTAISLSVICAIHCLFVPLVLLYAPTLTISVLTDEWFHTLLLFLVFPVSTLAMFFGCKQHKRYNILFYGIIGLMILAVSAIWGHDILGETGEIVATLLGASVLSFGHYRNQKLCKDCCN
tara:strand:- start:102 stop:491 length:390 start_codon:yes stop_codon:yes gene_type:complete